MSKDEAVAKLAALTGDLTSRYGVTINNQGERATVSGKGVSGSASISDTHVTIDLKLGLPASMIAARIESGVNKAIDSNFS